MTAELVVYGFGLTFTTGQRILQVLTRLPETLTSASGLMSRGLGSYYLWEGGGYHLAGRKLPCVLGVNSSPGQVENRAFRLFPSTAARRRPGLRVERFLCVFRVT